jgi:hypothetical protein
MIIVLAGIPKATVKNQITKHEGLFRHFGAIGLDSNGRPAHYK